VSDDLPRAAAFFDLDKTLMAGSSGMQFARIAAKQGIVGRRQLASWGFEHFRYRLRGTTDARTRGQRARLVPRVDAPRRPFLIVRACSSPHERSRILCEATKKGS